MERYYYSNSVKEFLTDPYSQILGALTENHRFDLDLGQKDAWLAQVQILKRELVGFEDGHLFFEFSIPRMGKRVDNILIFKDVVFILEFKIGATKFENAALEQVWDYALDLQNFHEGSHQAKIVPVLLATEAIGHDVVISLQSNPNLQPIKAEPGMLGTILRSKWIGNGLKIDPVRWSQSSYKPTPTIIEAAQSLYEGHDVKDISRSDAGAINLSRTTDCLNRIIEQSKHSETKSICFVTGVPGAGKTLAGLNLAILRQKSHYDEHAVFLSGNGPLVDVLREALARDQVEISNRKSGKGIKKGDAKRKTNSFIQNIHHFRDEALKDESAPAEKVVVFDEAQRAWTAEKASDFMKRRKGIDDFEQSEPEFLISVLDRHTDWATIVCLVGGGQEINTGEAGLEEWILALKNSFPDWRVFYSSQVVGERVYLSNSGIMEWLRRTGVARKELHLGVSIRSFRSESLSGFVETVLDLKQRIACDIYKVELKDSYPICLTRSLEKGKSWLREMAKGSETFGMVASSGALRLKPLGINIKTAIDAPTWFLNQKSDVRSSWFLEDAATEFDIQGLELDWVMVCWDANFFLDSEEEHWHYRRFRGTKWEKVKHDQSQQYLKNAYRVLLTRARQGMVIFVPEGDDEDRTRLSEYYDYTYNYFLSLGLEEI